MKAASSATLAILASGQYVKYDLYKFQTTVGTTLYCADSDYPVTVGGQLYPGGLIFKRGALTQKADLSDQTLTLTVAPQWDVPGGPPTIGGVAFLAAISEGLLDGAIVSWSKLFLTAPTPSTALTWPDTSPGAVPWFTGIIEQARAGRAFASLSINSNLQLLNVMMPRNLIQVGCSHMLYDAGCTLLKTAFRVSGSVTSGSALSFNTGLTQADHYFDLGVVTFTSGVNNGISRTVRTSLNASGNVTVILPFANAPAAGDTFTILPGCDKQQATCSTKFSNLTHFRGMPYVPVPETLYDGGTYPSPAPQAGGQRGGQVGSGPGGLGHRWYQP